MDTECPDVAVVIPTRNRSRLLRRLLGQVTSLPAGPSYEVVVVDEGSSDDTPELLRALEIEGRIRVVRHDPPRGLPAARNAGFRASTARYVGWIDDDDLTAPDRLAAQFAALDGGPYRWSCAARVDIDDDLEVIGHARCETRDDLLRSLLRRNVLPSAAQGLLVERQLVEEVGCFDESLTSAEDWDFVIRLAATAPPALLDEPLVGYRTGVASMSSDTERMEAMIRRVIDKHRDLYERLDVRPDWSSIHQSLLPGDLMRGRMPAARRALRAFAAAPSPGALRRFLSVLVAPRAYARVAASRRREQVPADWVVGARSWLDQVAS